MTDLVYVGPSGHGLTRFMRVANCGPSLDGATLLPSRYYTNVGGDFGVRAVANYHVVPFVGFDEWRRETAQRQLAAAAAQIEREVGVVFRMQGIDVELAPREGVAHGEVHGF